MAEGAEAGGRPPRVEQAPLALHNLLWLLAATLGVAVLLLEPLVTYSVFGSDSGEYFRLSAYVASTGHLPARYDGWGTAYPDFPGTFALVASAAGASGTSVFSVLSIGIPALAAFSVLPLFLLFRRIFPSDTVAILGAALASVMVPRAFSLAHPAPLALGDLLAIAALWMFVEGRRDLRWYAPLALTAAALVVTHHLSSYFFVVGALGGLLVVELWRPGIWSRRFPLRELAFSAGFLVGLVGFWFHAPSFLQTVSQGSIGNGPAAFAEFEAAALAASLVVGFLIRWRRSRGISPLRVSLPSDASVLRDFALLLVGTFGGILLIVFVDLPGTLQRTTPEAVAFFAPMLATVALAAGTRRLVTASPLGPLALAWLSAVGLSALVAIATSNAILIPARHAEYLVLPLALLVAVGIGRLVARAQDRAGRPALLAGSVAVVVLLAANASIAYPPPADFGGFQEGLTPRDAALWGWIGIGLAPTATVASDHRLSSMIFGFDGNAATWDSTVGLFNGPNRTMAFAELHGTYAPHAILPVDAVAVDGSMRTGVALNPANLSLPMSPEAIAWLSEPPFVPVYENGIEVVYWVAGPFGRG